MLTTILSNIRLFAILALVVAGVSTLTGFYVKGRLDATHAAELVALKDELARARHIIDVQNEAMKADAEQSKVDAAVIEQYEGQVNELLNKLEDADRECLSAADVDGLRKLWSEGDTKPAPSAPK